MRPVQRLALTTLTITTIALVGCGSDTPESLAKEQSAAMKQFVEILKSIKDKDSAAVAKTKLIAMSDSMKSLKKRSDALASEQKAELQKKVQEDVKPMMEEFMGEMFRVASLGPDVQKELEGVESAFKDLK